MTCHLPYHLLQYRNLHIYIRLNLNSPSLIGDLSRVHIVSLWTCITYSIPREKDVSKLILSNHVVDSSRHIITDIHLYSFTFSTCTISIRGNNLISIGFCITHILVLPAKRGIRSYIIEGLHHIAITIDIHGHNTLKVVIFSSLCRCRKGEVHLQSALGTCCSSKARHSSRSSGLNALGNRQTMSHKEILGSITDAMDGNIIIAFYGHSKGCLIIGSKLRGDNSRLNEFHGQTRS